MIDRISQRAVPPLIGLLRASTRTPPYPSNASYMQVSIWTRQSQCPSHTRFYASPPTDNFRGPSSADPRFEHQQTQTGLYEQPNFQHDPSYTTIPRGRHAPPPPPPPPPPSPPRRKRSLRPYIWATTFFLIGSLAGQYIRLVIVPPEPPLPGTREDAAQIALIHARAAKLPIVQTLSNDPAWRSWDAYSIFTTPEERAHRITTGPLGGARGLGGYQRIFYNATTGDFVSVLWIGGALSGWPGVVHGGLLATVLDESLGRCAIARFPERTGVTAKLEVNYRAPAVTNAFYVIKTTPVPEGSTERKSYVVGRLETLDGRICVEATGLFVLPKNIAERALKPVELRNLDEGF